jgi:hypothetical protein
MKRIIKPEDFPIEMNEENIEILARMKLNFPPPITYPPPLEWRMIVHLLSEDEKVMVSNKVREIRLQLEKEEWASRSPEEQAEEKRKTEESLKEGPGVYRGNILQQEWDSMYIADFGELNNSNEKNNNRNTS